MKNFKLIVAYEGTAYLGWQKTEAGPTIEEAMEKAVMQILQHPVKLQAASRTDAGVHAEGQVVNFFSETKLSLSRLQASCNALLPEDIRVLQVEEMPLAFHPTLQAKHKEYHYQVCLGQAQLPFDRRFSWHFVKPIDVDLVRKAAPFFIGKHDFSALTNEQKDDPVREVYWIEIEETGVQKLKIRVAGNRFLYKMVRNIAGTLLYAGCGAISLEEASFLLKNRDRKAAGMTAPAHGLSLKYVGYD